MAMTELTGGNPILSVDKASERQKINKSSDGKTLSCHTQ